MKAMISVRALAVLGAVLAIGSLGCGGSDDDDGEPACGTAEAPLLFEVTDQFPARGSSVANHDIVHRFTIVGNVGVTQLEAVFTPRHTAGGRSAEPQWSLTPDAGKISYMATPFRWAIAPAHVEIGFSGAFKSAKGCIYGFPVPVFSYDVTQ
jgi:hypothetical protein